MWLSNQQETPEHLLTLYFETKSRCAGVFPVISAQTGLSNAGRERVSFTVIVHGEKAWRRLSKALTRTKRCLILLFYNYLLGNKSSALSGGAGGCGW